MIKMMIMIISSWLYIEAISFLTPVISQPIHWRTAEKCLMIWPSCLTGNTKQGKLNLVSRLVPYKSSFDTTLLMLFQDAVTSSSRCERSEEAPELLLSVIQASWSKDYLQLWVKIGISSADIPAGLEIRLSRECSSGGVRLPRWVLEGKEELPHVDGMTSSLCTGPPFHMRSNPPTLFSLPVSLSGKQHCLCKCGGK